MGNNKTCTRCGEEKPATLEYFRASGTSLRPNCSVCHAKADKAYYRTPKGKFVMIRKSAKERGINFSLLFELYETQLWGKPCHYCGCKIEITGLDRKDSSKGYSLDNIVPCCHDCNRKKKDKPYDQFVLEQNLSEGHNK